MSGSTPDQQSAPMPPPVHRIDAPGRGWPAIFLVVCVAAALVGVALLGRHAPSTHRVTPAPGASASTTAGMPTPRSTLVSGFIEQIDGLYGYRMLRPANWTATGGDTMSRFYVAPGFGGTQTQGILVSVENFKIVADTMGGANAIAEWILFQQRPTLDGWTATLERELTIDEEGFTLLRTLPNAKIYAITTLAGKPMPFLEVVAYAIGQGQPFVITLQGSGTDRDLTRVEQEGILDDFATMVGSIEALPQDAQNVQPAMPTPAPPQPAPVTPGPSFAAPATPLALGTPRPGDAATASSLAYRYEQALVAGQWQTAWDLLALESQKVPYTDYANFVYERSAFFQSVAGRFLVKPPSHDATTLTSWVAPLLPLSANLDRAFLIEVDYPSLSTNPAGWTMLLVAPDEGGTWRIWVVR
jgi:hypothetical protein